MNISFFPKIFARQPERETTIIEFLNSVKHGTFKHLIEPINNEPNKKKRKTLKENTLPYVTISGLYPEIRNKEGLKKHSGFICLDIDDSADLGKDWENVTQDKHTFGAFKSASGLGIAVLIKVNPKKHLESFLSLERYYLEKFQIILDKSCKDVTRPRFVSYDPNAYINPKAATYSNFLKKNEIIKKLPNIITGQKDIEYIIEQINERKIDITRSSYHIWLEIGFAIAAEYGAGGRQYYHAISYYSEKYKHDVCEKQYDHCIKSKGNGVQIATLFYYAKEANLDLVSKETKHVVAVSKMGKRGARKREDVIKLLNEVDKIEPKFSTEIVNKIYDSKTDLRLTEELSQLEQVELFLKNNYNLKRNDVTRYIENNGQEVDSVFINSVWLQARRIVSEKTSFEIVEKLIGSDFVESYNPIQDFFNDNAHLKPEGLITKLCDCIDTDTGINDLNPSYKYIFITKWLIGIVSAAHWEHSPLFLALCGGQGTGKTEFFRRLLPKELGKYYAESKLDAGKDDEILMTQKLLIIDDELGGKSKQEAKRLKELTSKADFTLREPYGRKNVTLKRLAVLGGTTNDDAVLNDPTGNRRIIPINVKSINHGVYNSINKKDLFLEVYQLYASGFTHHLTREEIDLLNRNTLSFETINRERELINQFFKNTEFKENGDVELFMTATEIQNYIEEQLTGNAKINQWKMSQELKNLGFTQKQRKVFGKNGRFYTIIKTTVAQRCGVLYKDEGKKTDFKKMDDFPF